MSCPGQVPAEYSSLTGLPEPLPPHPWAGRGASDLLGKVFQLRGANSECLLCVGKGKGGLRGRF